MQTLTVALVVLTALAYLVGRARRGYLQRKLQSSVCARCRAGQSAEPTPARPAR
jgi:hypothetical protein